MEGKATDRRILRSRRLIREAMLDLLEEKPLAKIGISELCQRAEINRNTFYCHYSTPADVLAQMENEILDHLRAALTASAEKERVAETALAVLAGEKRLTRVLLSDHAGPHFSKSVAALAAARAQAAADSRLGKLDPGYQAMLVDFTIAGGAAVVKRWAEDGFQEPYQDVAKFLRILLDHGFQELWKEQSGTFHEMRTI